MQYIRTLPEYSSNIQAPIAVHKNHRVLRETKKKNQKKTRTHSYFRKPVGAILLSRVTVCVVYSGCDYNNIRIESCRYCTGVSNIQGDPLYYEPAIISVNFKLIRFTVSFFQSLHGIIIFIYVIFSYALFQPYFKLFTSIAYYMLHVSLKFRLRTNRDEFIIEK